MKLTKDDLICNVGDLNLDDPLLKLSRLREVLKEYNRRFGLRFKAFPHQVLGLLKEDFDELFGEVLE